MQRLASLFLLVFPAASGCAWFGPPRELAPAADYVVAAVDELSKGHFASAQDILLRAQSRFPDDEAVLRWSVEIHRMQWRFVDAIDLLLDLTRLEHLTTITRREVTGQIGDLLFEVGKYGESAHFLRSGLAENSKVHRRAKAIVTLDLPYLRRGIEHQSFEVPVFTDTWPAMLCGFGAMDRVCLLDTGSTMCTLAKSLAEEVGIRELHDFGMVRDSLGRQHSSWIGVLPQFAIGGVAVGPLPVLIVDDQRLALRDTFGGPDHPPRAVIGLDVLSRFRLVFDLTRKTVRFESPRGLTEKGAVAGLLVDGCMVFPVGIDGVDMWFILDTAASHSSLTEAGLRVLPGGERRALPDYRHPTSLAGRGFIARKVGGMVLQTSAVKFTGVEMPVVERLGGGSFPIHGVLGVDLIRRCRLTIDSGRILLDQVASAPEKGPEKR